MEDKELKQTTEYIEIQEENPVSPPDLSAPEAGKAWRRKADGIIFYGDLFFGYTSHLKKNRKETESDFELVDVEDISP